MASFRAGFAWSSALAFGHTLDGRGRVAPPVARGGPLSDGDTARGSRRWLRMPATRLRLGHLRLAAAGLAGGDRGASPGGAVLTRRRWEGHSNGRGLLPRGRGRGRAPALEQVRRRQGGNSLDAVMAFSRPWKTSKRRPAWAQWPPGLPGRRAAARGLEPRLYPEERALDVRAPRGLGGEGRGGRRAAVAHALSRLQAAGEAPPGEALLSLAYAPYLALRTARWWRRQRCPAPPVRHLPVGGCRRTAEMGVPWHVRGALVGLDMRLAGLSLRRLSADMPLGASGPRRPRARRSPRARHRSCDVPPSTATAAWRGAVVEGGSRMPLARRATPSGAAVEPGARAACPRKGAGERARPAHCRARRARLATCQGTPSPRSLRHRPRGGAEPVAQGNVARRPAPSRREGPVGGVGERQQSLGQEALAGGLQPREERARTAARAPAASSFPPRPRAPGPRALFPPGRARARGRGRGLRPATPAATAPTPVAASRSSTARENAITAVEGVPALPPPDLARAAGARLSHVAR